MQSALDYPVQFTFLPDRFATSQKRVTLPFRQLCEVLSQPTKITDKMQLPMIFPGLLGDVASEKGCLRTMVNRICNTLLMADYDAGDPQWRLMAEDRFVTRGIAAALIPSPSWTEAKPRYRVLAPLAEEIYAPADYERMVARLDLVLHGTLAAESYDAARAYFYGSLA